MYPKSPCSQNNFTWSSKVLALSINPKETLGSYTCNYIIWTLIMYSLVLSYWLLTPPSPPKGSMGTCCWSIDPWEWDIMSYGFNSILNLFVFKKTKWKYNNGTLERFSIRHFGKYHSSLCLSPQILHKHCFCFLLGPLSPKRNWKQCLCKTWGDRQRILWYFLKWPMEVESN